MITHMNKPQPVLSIWHVEKLKTETGKKFTFHIHYEWSTSGRFRSEQVP